MDKIRSYFFTAILLLITSAYVFAQEDTLQIFILVGQSNMRGYGTISGESIPGTLEYIAANDSTGIYASMTAEDGSFGGREDVVVHFDRGGIDNVKYGSLGVSFGETDEFIGPEYGFGFKMGDYFEENVLLIKIAGGGKSLTNHFRPPSASGETGACYNGILTQVDAVIENIPNRFPQFADMPYNIQGFGWHQGWSDGESTESWEEYEQNLTYFIQDIRADLGEPNLPFVIANTGIGGFEPHPNPWTNNVQTYIVPAQQNVADLEAFKGTVALADTRAFWQEIVQSPSGQIHHWNRNGWTYLNIGLEMGQKMIELWAKEAIEIHDAPNPPIPIIYDENESVFPNPVQHKLFLGEQLDAASIVITNIEGKRIQHIDLNEQVIDVSKLPNGVYFLSVFDTAKERIIKTTFIKY